MPAQSALITVMERAARKAGARLRRDFGEVEHLQVSKKGPADFVEKSHIGSERILYDELMKVRPGWGFVLEEGGMIEAEDGRPRWIVNPLDGVMNFMHGIPHFAVSIAVQDRAYDGVGWGKITSGMIYEPLSDQTWWAEMDKGAWLGEKRLRVSARRDLSESVIATGIPYKGHGDLAEWSRIFGSLAPQAAGIRRNGTASLDLAWLAAGRYDGFWEAGLQVWDVAAGILMVREAGGFVTDFTGGDQPVGQQEILAANEALHTRLHKILAKSLL
jgi:myo-inositol-1(or 4)-monophosphatase